MPLVLPLMRGGGLHFRVTLCWRGLCTTHIHRPITTYFLFAKIITTFDSCKYFSKFYHPLHSFSPFPLPFPNYLLLLHLHLPRAAAMSFENDGADGWSTTY